MEGAPRSVRCHCWWGTPAADGGGPQPERRCPLNRCTERSRLRLTANLDTAGLRCSTIFAYGHPPAPTAAAWELRRARLAVTMVKLLFHDRFREVLTFCSRAAGVPCRKSSLTPENASSEVATAQINRIMTSQTFAETAMPPRSAAQLAACRGAQRCWEPPIPDDLFLQLYH